MKIPPVTLDLTINIPFLLAVVGGIAAGSAAFATVDYRLASVEERTRNLPAIETQLARIDERSEAGKETLARIERQLEQVEQ